MKMLVKKKGENMELTYVYRERWNGKCKEKRFDSYESLGKWIADNATEIINIDCIQEEDI